MPSFTTDNNLVVNPQSVTSAICDVNGFSSIFTIKSSKSKNYTVSAYNCKSVAAIAFEALDGIGATASVKKGTFLFLKSDTKMQFRVTQKADTGPDVTSTEFVQGILIKEYPDANYIVSLEVLGTGKVEYFAAGNE